MNGVNHRKFGWKALGAGLCFLWTITIPTLSMADTAIGFCTYSSSIGIPVPGDFVAGDTSLMPVSIKVRAASMGGNSICRFVEPYLFSIVAAPQNNEAEKIILGSVTARVNTAPADYSMTLRGDANLPTNMLPPGSYWVSVVSQDKSPVKTELNVIQPKKLTFDMKISNAGENIIRLDVSVVGWKPSGTIEIVDREDGRTLNTAPLTNNTATFTLPVKPGGLTLFARYRGDKFNLGSESTDAVIPYDNSSAIKIIPLISETLLD